MPPDERPIFSLYYHPSPVFPDSTLDAIFYRDNFEVLKGYSPDHLRKAQDELLKAVVRIDEVIQQRYAASAGRVAHMEFSGQVNAWLTHDQLAAHEATEEYIPAMIAALREHYEGTGIMVAIAGYEDEDAEG